MKSALWPVATLTLRLGATACFALAAVSVHAWTNDEQTRTVAEVGTHNPSTGFVRLVEPVASLCVYQNLYFDPQSAVGKGILAVLISAKSSGQKVRVGYDTPAALGTCTLQMASLVS